MVNLCDFLVFKNVVKVIIYFKKFGLVICIDLDFLDWGGGWWKVNFNCKGWGGDRRGGFNIFFWNVN